MIEEEIFKRSSVNINKLESFGFKKVNNKFVYEKSFLNDAFTAVITIDSSISGKVIDNATNLEYTNIRTEMNGEFVNSVKEEYKSILIDIKNNCFTTNYFIYDQTNRITKYIKDKYNDEPEFLWDNTPGCGVFRNKSSNKWYGIIMNINISKIDSGNKEIEIINVKLNRDKIQELLNKKGFYRAYHMNKVDWITIILDDTVSDSDIIELIDESYNLVGG